jgi:hypothetical protein
MPPRRRCYERRYTPERCRAHRPVASSTAGATAAHRRPAWWNPDSCPRREFVRRRRAEGRQIAATRQPRPLAGGRLEPYRVSRPAPRRVLVCQFELPVPQFVGRRATMRRIVGNTTCQNLFVDTRPTGHLLKAPRGLNHSLSAARAAAAEIIVLDPLYSTHDQDENDTRAMAALCQRLLRLREASRAALIVVHHVRKSIGRYEISSAFRGSSALHAVGDSYLLLTRPSSQFHTVELRFQSRYAAPQPPRLLALDPDTPREHIMTLTESSKTHRATGDYRGLPASLDHHRRWPLPLARSDSFLDCPHGVAPGRMPKADATELAQKKSAYRDLPVHFIRAGGFLVSGPCRWEVLKVSPFLWLRLPSGGLGL